MGRGKVQLKLIEDKHSRQATFSKRRGGLMKKAYDLSVLYDVELALIVFSANGRLTEFCSGESLDKHLNATRHMAMKKRAPTNQSNLKVEQLTTNELTYLEGQLDATLGQTRLRKTQLMTETITTLSEQEKQLRETKDFLENKIAAMEGPQSNNDSDQGEELQLIELNDNRCGGVICRMLQLF